MRGQPLHRRFFSRGYRGLTWLILRLPYHDTQCGAKFFRDRTLWEIVPQIRLRGWGFDASVLFEMKRRRKVVCELPVEWSHEDGSKLSIPKQIPIMFGSIVFVRLFAMQDPDAVPTRWLWHLACRLVRRPIGEPIAVPKTQVLEAASTEPHLEISGAS